MVTGENDLKRLCERYLDGSASQHDMEVIREAAHKGSLPDEWQALAALLTTPLPDMPTSIPLPDDKLKAPLPDFVDDSTERAWQAFVAQQEPETSATGRRSIWFKRTAIAACIVLLIGMATLLPEPQKNDAQPSAIDRTPQAPLTADAMTENAGAESENNSAEPVSATSIPMAEPKKLNVVTHTAIPREVITDVSTDRQIAEQIQETLTEMDDCMTDINNFESQMLAVIN